MHGLIHRAGVLLSLYDFGAESFFGQCVYGMEERLVTLFLVDGLLESLRSQVLGDFIDRAVELLCKMVETTK